MVKMPFVPLGVISHSLGRELIQLNGYRLVSFSAKSHLLTP